MKPQLGAPRPLPTVCFVGAGPGAADLITLRGACRLAQAEVVLFDALTDPALQALAPQAQWVNVGKRGFAAATGQEAINALLLLHARAGRRVVRLKGGDPSVFGRLEEELLALAGAGIAAEVVPGVTAALAAAADSQRPLTRRGRGRSLRLCTAMTASESPAESAADSAPVPALASDSEVHYMAGRQLAALGRRLLQAGWPPHTPVHVRSCAGTAASLGSDHALADLAHAALLHAGRPTVVTVGEAARALQPTARGCPPAVQVQAVAAGRGRTMSPHSQNSPVTT